MGQLPEGSVTLIETEENASSFDARGRELGYVTQTTLSVDDTRAILERLNERFPALEAPAAESICYATTNRQEAVRLAAADADHFLIVGAPNSSNSQRLVEVARRAGARKAALVQTALDIPWEDIGPGATVGLSAGASAPEILVEEIIANFRERFETAIELAETAKETEIFPVMRALRDVPLDKADMAFLNGR